MGRICNFDGNVAGIQKALGESRYAFLLGDSILGPHPDMVFPEMYVWADHRWHADWLSNHQYSAVIQHFGHRGPLLHHVRLVLLVFFSVVWEDLVSGQSFVSKGGDSRAWCVEENACQRH